MFNEVIHYPLLGIPLIVYGGIATFILLFAAAGTAYATRKGIRTVSVKWHYRLAYAGMAFGFLHGLLGLISYL